MVTEKIDGSLGILYRDTGNFRIATRGSFSSTQAQWATDYLRANYNLGGLPEELTLLFEIVYPGNRILVDYQGRQALILLAIRNRHTGEYLPFYPDVHEYAQRFRFPLPKVYTLKDVEEIVARTCEMGTNEEGFVVEFSDGQRWKFKSQKYLELHRCATGLSFQRILRAVATGTVDVFRSNVPDEFLDECDRWIVEIQSVVMETKLRNESAFQSGPKTTRKDFARWVISNNKNLAPYLFARFDERPVEPIIYDLAFRNR